ncbi:MAG TPA: hypothetical protein VJ731_18900, partial [Terriglobales bacterium]|nr:hypothetical protein [Terriglobales bacterium]
TNLSERPLPCMAVKGSSQPGISLQMVAAAGLAVWAAYPDTPFAGCATSLQQIATSDLVFLAKERG